MIHRLRSVALLAALPCTPLLGQLTPAREFYGVGRPIPMTVALPAPEPRAKEVTGQPPAAEEAPAKAGAPAPRCEVVVMSAGAEAPLATVPVLPGKIDLAALVPMLWSRQPREVLFAQLRIDGKGAGAPVVLNPMLNRERAKSEQAPGAKRPTIKFLPLEGEEDVYSGIQSWVDRRALLKTDEGEVEIATRPDAAPLAAANFLRLVAGGFYDGTAFHRVVPLDRDNHPFVIQGGDPTGTGSGGCGYYVDLENSRLPHDLGVVSSARAADPDSNGSQFFICLSRAGTSRLDGNYAAFGVVTKGIEAVQRIARTPLRTGTDKPLNPPMIKSATLVDAPPMEPGRPPQAQAPAPPDENPPR